MISVPTTEQINTAQWKNTIEQALASMCRKAFLQYLLIDPATNGKRRRKRLAESGDVKVDVSTWLTKLILYHLSSLQASLLQ